MSTKTLTSNQKNETTNYIKEHTYRDSKPHNATHHDTIAITPLLPHTCILVNQVKTPQH